MEGVDLCESCEKLAKVFGMNENKKVRSCEVHAAQLIEKKMLIIDIAGYHFISTLEDAALFEKKKSLVQKGRGNLDALETICQMELNAIIANIEEAKSKVLKDVESRFEEMKIAATEASTEATRQLSQLKADLEESLSSKENLLSSISLLICSDLNVTQRFLRFGLADVSGSVSAVLSDSWTVVKPDIRSSLEHLDASQKNAAIENALAEAVEYAKKGISEALKYADSIIGDEASFEERKGKVLSEFFKQNKMQITQNVKWLQYSWRLRQQCAVWDLATMEVGKQLAGIFYHQFGWFSEAEEILRCCYITAAKQNPVSELSMLLCIEICGVYFASEKYQEVESLGLWILETFGMANFPSEHYWTTLFYTSSSMNEVSKNDEAKAIVENWRKRDIPKESKLGEMMRLLTCGINAPSTEAERYLLRAKCIGMSHFPTSPFTALALFHLGLSTARGEQCFLQAQSIYEVASPQSAQAAMSLTKLGNLSKAAKRPSKAEKYYRQAQSIFECTSSKSYNAAINFLELGDLCSSKKRWNEVKNCCQQVESIVKVASPGMRSRLLDITVKLVVLRICSAPLPSPPPVLQEERKQPVAAIQPEVKPAAPILSRQAHAQGTLIKQVSGRDGEMKVSPGKQIPRRIQRELTIHKSDPIPGIDCGPADGDFFHWTATITGPDGSPYEGGVFLMNIQIPTDYPCAPPKVSFVTRVYHPNIDATGAICLNILKDEWFPGLTIDRTLLSIRSLLPDPLLDDPLVPEIAHIYKHDRARYENIAREWTRTYAMPASSNLMSP